MFGQFLRTLRRTRQVDPLQVTMTGVRMGERFLQIGCDDAALIGALAAKVGLSGASSVAVFDEASVARARKAAARAGALVDVQLVKPGSLPADDGVLDMVVVDDTGGSFARLPAADQRASIAAARRALRSGGRIEVVEGLGGGILRGAIARPGGYEVEALLTEAGFRPVRQLAEKSGFRFVEGLNVGRST